jgi:hypothetical protein
MRRIDIKPPITPSREPSPFFGKGRTGFAGTEAEEQRQPFFNLRTQHTPPAATASAVQPKLTVGKQDDPFEQEADAMADQVVQRLHDPGAAIQKKEAPLSSSVTPFVQAKCSACEAQEEGADEKEVNRKAIDSSPFSFDQPVQRKCSECEKEEHVQQKATPGIQAKAATDISTPSASSTPASVQMKCAACGQEEQVQKKEQEGMTALHRKSIFESNEPPPDEQTVQAKKIDTSLENDKTSVEQSLSRSKGGGAPLSRDVNGSMSQAFGADFSGVRIHTDNNAVQMSRDLNAQAFTHGNDIYFNEGKYDTGSDGGRRLLAHELTHTVQQGAVPASSPAADNVTSTGSMVSKASNGWIMREPNFTSTIEICHELLESRHFEVTEGSVMVDITPHISAPDIPNCVDHNFQVTLMQDAGRGFSIELPTIDFNSGGGQQITGWMGVPNGTYYLTISRGYVNPDCCLLGDISVTEGNTSAALINVCDYMYQRRLFPSQNGGDWDWAGTGTNGRFGPGPALEGPMEVYQRDPGLASGSTCRGACGPNCDTCTSIPQYVYSDPETGLDWLYTNWQECGSHDGCRQHDAAFDWAAAVHGEVGRGAELMRWHMAANMECACVYNMMQCGGWILGREPHDRTMFFADSVEQISGGGTLQNQCREANPGFTDCNWENADRDEVLELWGMENGYTNFRNCAPHRQFPEGIIQACDLGPGQTWHCTATDVDTRRDVIISIFECYCCNEDGESGSDWREPHLSIRAVEGPLADAPPSTEVPMITQDTYDTANEAIRSVKYPAALDTVVLDLIGSGRVDPSLFRIAFDERRDSGEGLCTTNYDWDDATEQYIPNDRSQVTIYAPAFANVQWLVSSIMHEYQHVLQQQRPRDAGELRPENQGGSQGEENEVAEVEAYLWELENAADTGMSGQPDGLREAFDRLTDHYNALGELNPQRQAQYASRYETVSVLAPSRTSEEEELERCDQGQLPPDYCEELYDRVRRRFGGSERDPNLDPDTDIDRGRQRVDDAPLLENFRLVYNRLDSWDVYVRRMHEYWYPQFTTKFELNKKRDAWLAHLKERTATYKRQFRNVENTDPDASRRSFEAEIMDEIELKIDQLNHEIASWYKEKTGSTETLDEIIERIHVVGTELWREEWLDAVLAVNRVLSSLWPPAKTRIISWVEEKRRLHPGEDLRGTVNDLDYVGSLATGVKGAPKQFIRFNVNSFDVDGNLEADPLARYAMKIDGIKPDRQRIFTVAQGTSITPLIDFCHDAHRALSEIRGYKVDDPFDVVIKAPETPEQRRGRLGTDRIYALRETLDGTRYNAMIEELRNAGLMEEADEGHKLKEELTREEERRMNEILRRYES